MGLQDLRAEILRRTFEEIKKTDTEAAAEARRLLGEAEEERKKALADARAEADKLVHSEATERASAARLKAARLESEAVEEAVSRGIDAVWLSFLKVRSSDTYPKLLKSLISEGVREVGGHGAIIYVRAKDAKLVKDAGQALTVKISEELEGGAIISSRDGRVMVRSTLRDLFDRHRDEVKRQVYDAMFGVKKG